MAVLHAGQEVTALEYISRVAVYLVAFGGIALVVYWGLDVIDGVRSVFAARDEPGEVER